MKDLKNMRIVNMSKVSEEQYIKDLEHDIDMLATMVLDLRKENDKLKTNLKEVGGKDTYEYLYGGKNENQLELFDE